MGTWRAQCSDRGHGIGKSLGLRENISKNTLALSLKKQARNKRNKMNMHLWKYVNMVFARECVSSRAMPLNVVDSCGHVWLFD